MGAALRPFFVLEGFRQLARGRTSRAFCPIGPRACPKDFAALKTHFRMSSFAAKIGVARLGLSPISCGFWCF